MYYPQAVQAEQFTGAQFLQWEEKNQNAFITDSVVMMIIVTGESQHGDKWADCVGDWFFDSKPERLRDIQENIARFETYHPQTTIFASAEKACGEF